MNLKFRFYDKVLNKIVHRNIQPFDIEHKEITVMQFTGFTDKNGKEIFDGDIISDWNMVDGKKTQSKLEVFWNQPTGSWHLDCSDKQDKSYSVELWLELSDFKYEITGNIHEK